MNDHIHLCSSQLLPLGSHLLEDLGVEVHCAYPHAHGPAGLGHLFHLLRDKVGVVDVLLELLQDVRPDVVLIVLRQPFQEVRVPQDLLGTCPVSPEGAINRYLMGR